MCGDSGFEIPAFVGPFSTIDARAISGVEAYTGGFPVTYGDQLSGVLLLLLRLAGKRELGQLNAFDLVVLILLSTTLQNAIVGDEQCGRAEMPTRFGFRVPVPYPPAPMVSFTEEQSADAVHEWRKQLHR